MKNDCEQKPQDADPQLNDVDTGNQQEEKKQKQHTDAAGYDFNIYKKVHISEQMLGRIILAVVGIMFVALIAYVIFFL